MPAREEDNRAHKRLSLSCRVSLFGRGGELIATGKTVNVCDGGALVLVDADRAPRISASVNVALSLPRKTPNTYMLEEVASSASVVRHQPADGPAKAIALRFKRPLDLGLEV